MRGSYSYPYKEVDWDDIIRLKQIIEEDTKHSFRPAELRPFRKNPAFQDAFGPTPSKFEVLFKKHQGQIRKFGFELSRIVGPNKNVNRVILTFRIKENIDQKSPNDRYPSIKLLNYEAEDRDFENVRLAVEKAFTLKLPPDRKKVLDVNSCWKEIETAFDLSKRNFGKKIAFIKDDFKRNIIFRDVEQAYLLAEMGFNKPAVTLAGSVIEELLRLYLESKKIVPVKNDFDGYIKTCENKRLLKSAIHRLTESVRQFRNFVHLEKEISTRHTISKATAKGAVASIFTIANDLE